MNKVSFSNDSSNEESSINNSNLGNFSFIEVDEKIPVFKYNPFNYNKNNKLELKKIANINPFYFIENKDDFTLIINIFIEDDSFNNSDKLRKIFNLLFLSLNDLIDLKISNKNILVTLFFSNFTSEKTFNQLFPYIDYLSAIYNNKEFLCSSCYIVSSTGIPLNILCFYKNKSTRLENLKLFYSYIIFDIKFFEEYNKKTFNNFLRKENIIKSNNDEVLTIKALKNNDINFYVLNWGLGIIPTKTSIGNLIRTAGEKNITIIPKIECIPYNLKIENIFGAILKNYYIIKDIENYFYFINTCVPIDHRFNFMRIDKSNFDIIKYYYINNICIDSSNYYNDYKFSLYLYDNYYVNVKNTNIFYISDIEVIYYENKINFNDFMNIYCSNNIGKYLSLFDNFYHFLFKWNDFNFKKFIKKIFQIFHIFNLFLDFILFGITFMIIKCILSEAFSEQDERVINFFLILYMLFVIISMIFSVMSPNIHKNDITFELINILFVVYFFFMIIASIFAIINIKKENDKSNYVYNQNQMIILIILNVVFYIIPYFLDFKRLKNNIINMGIYFIVYPSILTVFNFYIQMNVMAYYGRNLNYINYKKIKSNNNIINERKKTFILIYIFTNFIFIFLIFFLTDRAINMNCIFILTVIFTCLHGFKVVNMLIGYIHISLFSAKKKNKFKHSTIMEEKMKNQIFDEKYIIKGNEEELINNNTDKDKDKDKEEELIKNNLTSATTLKNDNKSNKNNINDTEINNKTNNLLNGNNSISQEYKELFTDLKPSMEISNLNKNNKNNNVKFEIKLNNKLIN